MDCKPGIAHRQPEMKIPGLQSQKSTSGNIPARLRKKRSYRNQSNFLTLKKI